jgi:hypothetical protein
MSKYLESLKLQFFIKITTILFVLVQIYFLPPFLAQSSKNSNLEIEFFVHNISQTFRNDTKECEYYNKYKEGKTDQEFAQERKSCVQNTFLTSGESFVSVDMTIWNKSNQVITYFGGMEFSLISQSSNYKSKFEDNFGFNNVKFVRFLGINDKTRGIIVFKVNKLNYEEDFKLKIEKSKQKVEIDLGKIDKFAKKELEKSSFENSKNAQILKYNQKGQMQKNQKHRKTQENLDYKIEMETLDCQDVDIEKKKKHSSLFTVQSDYKIVMCKIRFTNQSNFPVSAGTDISIKNKDGLTFENLYNHALSKFKLYDNVLPGDKIISESYFEVPKDFGDFRVYVVPNQFVFDNQTFIFEK